MRYPFSEKKIRPGHILAGHTDITIPYEELGSIEVIRADGSRIPVISGGRFVVPGTEALNESLDEAGK